MQLELTPAQQDFQACVRDFFTSAYPQDLLEKARAHVRLSRDDHVLSQQALNARGWLGVGWPSEHGGTGWSPVERYIFDAELERAGAPNLIPMAIIYIGPIICAFGTEEQRARWLPDILASRAMWAQGYSEPEAGSDLASLRFSAVRDGDDYILDGTKIWTSSAHWADWIFCLARTSREGRKQDGISMICADMRTPGIRVHRLGLIDGSSGLCRVEFDAVRVPAANRIGEEGRGWHYANVLLASERLSYAHIARKREDLAAIRAWAAGCPADFAASLLDEPVFAHRLAACEIEIDALEIAVLRALTSEPGGATISALKILCTEAAQHVSELRMELAGRRRLPMLDRSAGDWAAAAPQVPDFASVSAPSYFYDRAQTIYGGATEVQKTIVWRQIERSGGTG